MKKHKVRCPPTEEEIRQGILSDAWFSLLLKISRDLRINPGDSEQCDLECVREIEKDKFEVTIHYPGIRRSFYGSVIRKDEKCETVDIQELFVDYEV